jgi:hypothetical protein
MTETTEPTPPNEDDEPRCTTCGHSIKTQHSANDKKYLELFGVCWTCDRKLTQTGKMKVEDFERREQDAAKAVEEASVDGQP